MRNLFNCGLWLHCTGVSHTPRMKNSTLMTLIEQINADFYPSSLLACPDAYREGVYGYLFSTNICAVQTKNTRGHCGYRPRRGHMFIVNHWVLLFDPIGVVPCVCTICYKHVIPSGLGFCHANLTPHSSSHKTIIFCALCG